MIAVYADTGEPVRVGDHCHRLSSELTYEVVAVGPGSVWLRNGREPSAHYPLSEIGARAENPAAPGLIDHTRLKAARRAAKAPPKPKGP